MPDIVTTLSAGYQQTEWSVREALREIISNAFDGEERNKYEDRGQAKITYSKRSKTFSVSNIGVSVPSKALLMGTSESRADSACIGQFGEGLPMALLVLAREGFDVTIINGAEKWTPKIQRSDRFEGEPVLVVSTRKLIKARDEFTVTIDGIEPEEYEDIRGMFLKLSPEFDETQTVKRNLYCTERVLLQPEMKGRIFNKGVFVQKREDLLFGYDLDMNLNRDRAHVDEYELQYKLGWVLEGAVCNDAETFAKSLIEVLLTGANSLEARDSWSRLKNNSQFCDAVTEEWVARFGFKAVPADSPEEVSDAEALGMRGVISSPLIREIIHKTMGSLSEAQEAFDRQPVEAIDYADLTAIERHYLRSVKDKIRAVCPWWTGQVSVVTFGSQTIEAILVGKEVKIARRVLASWEDTLIAVTGQVCEIQEFKGSMMTSEAHVNLLAKMVQA